MSTIEVYSIHNLEVYYRKFAVTSLVLNNYKLNASILLIIDYNKVL